jgi:hypothetical protein
MRDDACKNIAMRIEHHLARVIVTLEVARRHVPDDVVQALEEAEDQARAAKALAGRLQR